MSTWPDVLFPHFFYSSHSENFIKKFSSLNYNHYWNQVYQTSARLDYIIYTQTGFNKLIAKGIFLGQTWRQTRELILKDGLEPIQYKRWNQLLWNANGSFYPNDAVHLVLQGFREVVETFPAFAHHTSDNQYNISLTLDPFPYFQLFGSYDRLNFSDSNVRNGYFLSATYSFLSDVGLGATIIERGFSDKFISPDYFSPRTYRAETVLLRLGRKIGPAYHYYLDGGIGQQHIRSTAADPIETSPTHQWGIGLNGPLYKYLSFIYIMLIYFKHRLSVMLQIIITNMVKRP